ncbi:CDP-glycerol glycerophosphotransferase family protein [Bacillus sp. JJ1533]|uniref:CDP-glycerol glycerophosphotransferase family protein n=1 Tax=Bacillus sp. JJ1533 TaxID=3122959 RepID=UPI003000717B
MHKILLVCYGGGHARIIEKVYQKLSETTNFKIEILAFTAAVPYFKNKNIKIKTILDYEIKTDEGKNKQEIESLIPVYKDNALMTKEEHYKYNYLSIYDLLESFSYNKVKNLIQKFGRRVYLPKNTMKQILMIEKPSLLITTSSPRMEKAALISAKKLGIRSVSIEDLFGKVRKIDLEIDEEIGTNEYSRTFGDNIFVMNNLGKQNLLNLGIDEERIVITGNPNFDDLINFNNIEKINQLKSNMNIPEDKTKIIYLAQQTDYVDQIMSRLKEIIKNNNFYLIVKLHPNQGVFHINEKNILVVKDNLYDYISMVDLAITEYSTTGLEALLLKKKLISIQLSNEFNEVIPFRNLGNTTVINSIDDLEETLIHSLNQVYKETPENFKQPFNATDKIINVLIKITQEELLDA